MSRQERTGMYRVGEAIVRSSVPLFTSTVVRGEHNLPTEGGYVIAINHVSYVDPMAIAYALMRMKVYPYFLAKDSLFRLPIAGHIMRKAEQIPVHRHSSEASMAYESAKAAVREGKVVAIFPEGTITRDPDLWPMEGKWGAARIALETGCPIVPAATWGGHRMIPAYGRGKRKLFPRTVVEFSLGVPRLVERQDGEVASGMAAELTREVMADIVALLRDLRANEGVSK